MKSGNLRSYIKKTEINETMCTLRYLLPSILRQHSIKAKGNGIKKTRLAKIGGYVIEIFGAKEQKDSVIWYSYGPYPLNLEQEIEYLKQNNIINVENDKLILTEQGLRWISNKLADITSEPQYLSIIKEIDNSLFIPTDQLIYEIVRRSPHLKPKLQSIGSMRYIRLFDWENYGSGIIQGYHYTLLKSFAIFEKYLEKIDIPLSNEEAYGVRIIDYDEIPYCLKSNQLEKKYAKMGQYPLPLTKIFEKEPPPYIKETKIEGKNYIYNLWYIVDAVNIIHVLSNLAPSIDEIARLCLTNYLLAAEKKDLDRKQLRIMREQLIRNDINRLWEGGILIPRKYKRKYFYSLSARCFHDVVLDRDFKVLDPEIVNDLYNLRIKPQMKLDFEKETKLDLKEQKKQNRTL